MERQDRSRGAPRHSSPLRRYLNKHKVSAASVGARMARDLGKAPSSASLSQWSAGVQAPSPRAQLAMAAATDGEVTPIDWARWRAKLQRLRSEEKLGQRYGRRARQRGSAS